MDDEALTVWLCEQVGEIHGWSWDPTLDDDYPSTDVGVHYGRIAPKPDRGVGVRVYGGTDDDTTDSKTRRVQLRFRGRPGDPAGADHLADVAHTHLRHLMREGVISEVIRQSFSPSSSDSNRREERTDNYLIIFDNPEAHT